MILVYIGRNNLIMCMFKKVGNFFFCLKINYRFFCVYKNLLYYNNVWNEILMLLNNDFL